MAAQARLIKPKVSSLNRIAPGSNNLIGSETILAIGASTGGTEAIKYLLMQFPAAMPAIVITQHMPPGFTKTFATRLNSLCQVRVKEAEQGERLLAGCAYIAPGDQHLEVVEHGVHGASMLVDSRTENDMSAARKIVSSWMKGAK